MGTAAGSLGQFLIAPLAQQFIDLFGWSGALNAMALMALAMIALVMPLARLVRPGAATPAESGGESFADTVGLARGHLSYWLLTIGFFVCGFHLAFITVHFPGYLTDNGFDPKVAAWSIALIGLFNVAGAMVSGYVSGRMSLKRVLMFTRAYSCSEARVSANRVTSSSARHKNAWLCSATIRCSI